MSPPGDIILSQVQRIIPIVSVCVSTRLIKFRVKIK